MKNKSAISYRIIAAVMLGLLYCLAFSTQAIERVQHHSDRTFRPHQWDVIDIRFRAETLPAQPVDATFSAVFRNAGKELLVQGFYNGDREYLLRFTPPTPGAWTYETRSSIAPLNGKTGKLSVRTPRDGRKGGISVNPKAKRRFRYADGDEYYPIAFESDWLFALDAENPKGIPVTRRFVDQLVDSGFNQIVMNVFAYDVSWKKDERLISKFEYGSPKSFPFGGENKKPDFSQLDIEYFQRLDRVIDYLDQKGVAAHLMIYVWNKLVNWPPARSAEDNRYFDYVVKRYQAFPNMVWDISKEALGYGHTDVTYIHDRIQRLRQLDSYQRLVTVHDYSYNRRFTDRVDFISVQLWGSELYGIMRKVVQDMPGKPILNIEHGGYERGPYVVFEGNYTSPEVCLERAWQCVFAGTYPTHYWQGAAWNVIIPDIAAMRPEARPRLDYYRHMNDFVAKYHVGALKAGDKKSASGFCLHNGNDLLIYYVPKENSHIDVRSKDKRGEPFTGRWFNPFNGRYEKTFSGKLPQWPRYQKPEGDGFRILVIEIAD